MVTSNIPSSTQTPIIPSPALTTANASSNTHSAQTPPPVAAISNAAQNITEVVTAAKQKLLGQIGLAAADKVVNKDGSINYSKLAQILAQQKAAKAAQNDQSQPDAEIPPVNIKT